VGTRGVDETLKYSPLAIPKCQSTLPFQENLAVACSHLRSLELTCANCEERTIICLSNCIRRGAFNLHPMNSTKIFCDVSDRSMATHGRLYSYPSYHNNCHVPHTHMALPNLQLDLRTALVIRRHSLVYRLESKPPRRDRGLYPSMSRIKPPG
jgi:hypothetical protein